MVTVVVNRWLLTMGTCVPRDIDVVTKGVIDLGDLQGHLILRIDQRNDFQAKLDILVAHRGRHRGAAAVIDHSAGGAGG